MKWQRVSEIISINISRHHHTSIRKRMVMNLSGGESGWSDSSTELSNWRQVSLTGSSSGCPSRSQKSVNVVADYHLSL